MMKDVLLAAFSALMASWMVQVSGIPGTYAIVIECAMRIICYWIW